MSDPKLERAKQDYANLLTPALRPLFGDVSNLKIEPIASTDGKGSNSTTFRIQQGNKILASIVSQAVEVGGVPSAHAVIKFGDGDKAVRLAWPISKTGTIDPSAVPTAIDASGKVLSEADRLKIPSTDFDKARRILSTVQGINVPNPHYNATTNSAVPQNLALGNFLSRLDSVTGRVNTAAFHARPTASA